MPPRPSRLETVRRTRKTLNIVAGFYVAVGLIVTAGGAITANPLAAFLGFLMVSVALACAIGLGLLFQLETQLAEVAEDLRQVRSAMEVTKPDREQALAADLDNRERSSDSVDLAKLGTGRPDPLVAATLDGSTFPRLVAGVNQDQPLPSGREDESAAGGLGPPVVSGQAHPGYADGASAIGSLMREWETAFRAGDLPACRSVCSALVGAASPSVVATLKTQLEELACSVEAKLRKAFSTSIRARDYATALSVGEQICKLLPDHRLAGDFRRIQPQLSLRGKRTEESGATKAMDGGEEGSADGESISAAPATEPDDYPTIPLAHHREPSRNAADEAAFSG